MSDAGNGRVLVLTHVFTDRRASAQQAAGWDGYLDRLEALVSGGFLPDAEGHRSVWQRHEAYADQFGFDPEPGRRALAEHRPI